MFQPTPVLFSIVFTLLVLAIGEIIVQEVGVDESFDVSRDEDILFTARSLGAPNFWIWYNKKAVIESIEAQHHTMFAYICLACYNACLSSPTVFVSATMTTMFLLLKVFPRNSKWMSAWLILAVAFVCDVVEDALLIVIALGYPFFQYPTLLEILPWCSFLKFTGWGIIGLLDALLVMKWFCTGPLEDFSHQQ